MQLPPPATPGCILFSHLPVHVDEQKRETPVERFPNYQRIKSYQKHLNPALHATGTSLWLFYDAGWVQFMNAVGDDFDFPEFVQSSYAAVRLRQQVENTPSIRLLTTHELSYFVNRLRGDQPGEEALAWRRFFVSDSKKMRYDCSKVVEAIVRLRQLGSGIPVFRIDYDVLDELSAEAAEGTGGMDPMPQWCGRARGAAGLEEMLRKAHENHRQCVDSPDTYSFVFSGSYRPRSLPADLREWMGAYATRMFPALLMTRELMEATGDAATFAGIVEECGAFDAKLACDFFGLRNEPGIAKLKERLSGIALLGANPLSAVISGSLLCLSDGAILDLPPFSNFRSNVVWVDDHLKYAALRGLSNLSQREIWVDPLPGCEHYDEQQDGKRRLVARIPCCYLPKGRPTVDRLGVYLLQSYLPSLLRGMIVDAWVMSNPTGKRALGGGKEGAGALVQSLQEALVRGRFEPSRREDLRLELRQVALARIGEIRDEWRDMPRTFARVWLLGEVSTILEDMNAGGPGDMGRILEELKRGTGDDGPIGLGVLDDGHGLKASLRFEHLKPAVQLDLERLIDDAMGYIDWALHWPRLVQTVRAFKPKPDSPEAAFDLRRW